jgi:hypothetical protein
MNDAFYFPIHRAKAGEIAGVAHLSPRTRTRVRPAFEIQKQRDDDDTPLEEHLSRVAHQLLAAWGSRYPLFADFSQFGPEDRTADGTHCAEFFFRCLRQQSMLGIPMTGPESVRGPGYGYIDAVAGIASEDGRGAALRLPFEEFSASDKVEHAISDSLRALRLEPPSVDLFLDFETLALLPAESRAAPGMAAVRVDVLREYGESGFRNIVICGSSVPDGVNKEYDGSALRVERTEIVAWQSLIENYSKGLIKFGDYGVIHALERDVDGPVRPPARIRLSTAGEHVLWRAARKDYIELSEKVVASQDFDPELAAWGCGVLRLCARYGRGERRSYAMGRARHQYAYRSDGARD